MKMICKIRIGQWTYTVEARNSDDAPYVLCGTRGAKYMLMRNRANPWCLFVTNLRVGRRVPDGIRLV